MNLKKIRDNEINPGIVISILNQLYAEELQAFYDYANTLLSRIQ